uniref:Uncharacterized protein n=1 Tax=Rhizophora mucronata TaxID=61149 RepID=A0A2P2JG97_RHIMU
MSSLKPPVISFSPRQRYSIEAQSPSPGKRLPENWLSAKLRTLNWVAFWQIWEGSEALREFEERFRTAMAGKLMLCGTEPVKSLKLKSRTSSLAIWKSDKGSESSRKLLERLRVLS